MGSDSIPLWIIFIICVIGGAYFAAAESSFTATGKIKIKALADEGNRRAKGAMYILNEFDRALTTLLIGNNVTKIAGAAVFTILATDIFKEKFSASAEFLESFAFSIMCSVMSTVIIFLFSEMIPKSFANDRSESVSLFFASSLKFLMKVLYPVALLFNFITSSACKLSSRGEEEPSITEDELGEIIETAEEEGTLNEEQGDMLKSALEFARTTVDEIMTMDKDIESISIGATTEEILRAIAETNYSRLPVRATGSSRIIGILRTRSFLAEYRKNKKVTLRSVMSLPYVVSEKAKIDDLLTDMRQHKIGMAVVHDDAKNVVGLVTVEDILEELVGEIFDEEDEVDQNFQSLGGNKYMINTHMLALSAYEKMGLGKPPRAIASKPLISIILETLGRLPEEDESFLFENLEITAKTVEEGRVSEVVVHVLDEEDLEKLQASEEEEVEK